MATPLLEVRNLVVEFRASRGRRALTRAVDDVSLRVEQGQVVGLIGESGSGKSTIGNAILGLVRSVSGEILLDGENITYASGRRRRRLTDRIQVVFQDPYGSLNPHRQVGKTLADPLRVRGRSRDEIKQLVTSSLEAVGLSAESAERYPAQFSGGQRQRIAIARALILRPQLIICDEPTSSLDISVQAQVLNLLMELRERRGLSFLFVSHDLAVIRHVADRVVVLRNGQVAEEGLLEDVTQRPVSEYTRLLLSANPVSDPTAQATRRIDRERLTLSVAS